MITIDLYNCEHKDKINAQFLFLIIIAQTFKIRHSFILFKQIELVGTFQNILVTSEQIMFRITKQLLFKASSVQQSIEHTIRGALSPSRLEIVNQSHLHSRGKDTHFNLLIVSSKFKDLPKVQQHQLVYTALGSLMKDIHALTITCYPEDSDNTQAWSLDCFHKKAK